MQDYPYKDKIEPRPEISINVVCATSKASDQPAHKRSGQSDQSLCLSLEYSMSVKLLTEHHLEFLSLKGGCTGSSESTLVKMPHCWKSLVAAHINLVVFLPRDRRISHQPLPRRDHRPEPELTLPPPRQHQVYPV